MEYKATTETSIIIKLYNQLDDRTSEFINASFTQLSFPVGSRIPYSHSDFMRSFVRFTLVSLNYLAMVLAYNEAKWIKEA